MTVGELINLLWCFDGEQEVVIEDDLSIFYLKLDEVFENVDEQVVIKTDEEEYA
ncbi:hypothetical protein HB884_16880 [Listeria booriae]|uniref:Uncharacterized protein n=1 Tax=Listeria booriae TaxID=1552123 RepID=A0A7X0XB57_9LIST|nr:hypothetical protein [Listeria booriae]MBC1490971.1 hypothetical protein [Listeria booriae]MBC1491114.1 hypothetical protein [Listeria booriae]MBC1491423.1 hypothetical protein [Listeria booriae]MBC1525878.1 hypothetical protein [Listeria booriae]